MKQNLRGLLSSFTLGLGLMRVGLSRLGLSLAFGLVCASLSAQTVAPATPAPAGVVKQLGSILKISGADLTLATDQGAQLAVKVQAGAHILRLAPGQTDLKSASPIQLSDLQVGDRVLVRGNSSADGSIDASAVVVMKQQDIAHKNQQELLDWQRRGVGGLVKQVDTQSGNITLTVSNKTVVVSTTPKTTFKRYAPDSVKWEDATTANLDDIHPGDQLRAKGSKKDDGTQLAAEEIVAGTFRNIAGLVTAVDPGHSTLTVQDLATKMPVTVTINADSQMKKLPPQLAQGLAMRLKGGTASGAASNAPPTAPASAPAPADGARPRGGGDLNQILARLPAATLGDLQKGEAVMIVSTQGSAAQPPAAITLLAGVEPILTAAPDTAGQSLLTPWSLASAPGGEQ
jgi:co-chaperonin GroES (HSP10)